MHQWSEEIQTYSSVSSTRQALVGWNVVFNEVFKVVLKWFCSAQCVWLQTERRVYNGAVQ